MIFATIPNPATGLNSSSPDPGLTCKADDCGVVSIPCLKRHKADSEVPSADQGAAFEEPLTVADAEELEIPPSLVKEVHIGKESMKQYLASAALLQQVQHNLLYGDLTAPRVTQGAMVKLTFLGVKRAENASKMARFVDAAASTC